MHTSYFAKYKGDKGVSIALYPPRGFTGRKYLLLSPSRGLLAQYNNGYIDKPKYAEMYYDQLYKRGITVGKLIQDLDPESVLLCHEKPGEMSCDTILRFCSILCVY
jgi:hypothetical protein